MQQRWCVHTENTEIRTETELGALYEARPLQSGSSKRICSAPKRTQCFNLNQVTWCWFTFKRQIYSYHFVVYFSGLNGTIYRFLNEVQQTFNRFVWWVQVTFKWGSCDGRGTHRRSQLGKRSNRRTSVRRICRTFQWIPSIVLAWRSNLLSDRWNHSPTYFTRRVRGNRVNGITYCQ